MVATESGAARFRWMSIKNVMTRSVICVRASDSVKNAWLVIMEAGITGAPVVDDAGTLVGVLSISDIFKAILERVQKARTLRELTTQLTDPSAVEKEEVRELSLAIRAVAESTVSSILPKDQKVLSLGPEDSLERAIRIMAEANVNRLPVVKGTQVVGIVTRQDVICAIAGKPTRAR